MQTALPSIALSLDLLAIQPPGQPYRILAVYDQGQWCALVLDLDIAAQADSYSEVMQQAEASIRAALRWAAESEGRVPGELVPDEDIRTFMLRHNSTVTGGGAQISVVFA